MPGALARIHDEHGDTVITDVLAHRYDRWNAMDLVGPALKQPVEFPAGTQWSYSNTNYLIAAMIVEKVTGDTYGAEIRRRILRPLRLNATFVPDDAATLWASGPVAGRLPTAGRSRS
ncbi:serine hydrolase [Sphaerisporangium fuscum]|uniref:serine hydrolase n=1 Tax=Sphaerisporangium fuscum TaxID=2835868 RepID=UPI0027E2E49E|nr:serine hydrolase [Sphaerisporangium fuscum]